MMVHVTSLTLNARYHEQRKAQLTNIETILSFVYLQRLDISHNQLTQADFSPLQYLHDVDVSHNRIISIKQSKFPVSLRRLNLGSNGLLQLDGLGHLPSLTHIELQHNQLTSLNLLATSCPLLCEIDASSNQLSHVDEISKLSSCSMLFKIVIANNPLIQENDDESVGWLERVMYLIPQLEIIQSDDSVECTPLPVESLIVSCSNYGDDDQRREKLTRFYRCRGDRTRAHHIDAVARMKWAASVGVQRVLDDERDVNLTIDPTTGLTIDLVRQDVRAFLAEPRFWTLMAERGFTRHWIDVERAIHQIALVASHRSQHVDLNFDGLQLGDVGMRCVAQALLSRTTRDVITGITLDGADQHARFTHQMGNHYGLVHLLQSISMSNVSTLSMRNCSFGITECGMIADQLISNVQSGVQHLDLSFNNIGVHQMLESVQIRECPGLNSLLSSQSIRQLLTLNLSHNGIDHQGARQIAAWLLECQAQTLILDANPLDDRSVELISQSLSRNSTVHTLSMSGLLLTSRTGGVSINTLTSLTSCLATSNDTVRSINLSNNRLLCSAPPFYTGLSAGTLIAQWLKRDPRFRSSSCVLRSVDLTNTGLAACDLLAIADVIHENNTLQSLKLSISDSYAVTVDQSSAFLNAIQSSSLITLEAHGLRCDVTNSVIMRSLNLVCSRHPSLVSLAIGPVVGCGPADRCYDLPRRSTVLKRVELIGESQRCVQSIDRILLEMLQITSLVNVTLRSHNLPFETIRVLTSMFAGFSKIESMSFVDCCFPPSNELEPMFDSMFANSYLHHLTLERTHLHTRHWQGFLDVMQSRKSNLSSIRLSGCGLSHIDVRSARRLLNQSRLVELDLSNNLFDAQSIHHLIHHIPSNRRMQRFNMTSGQASFRFDARSFNEQQNEWSMITKSLIARFGDVDEIGLPHINIQNSRQNDEVVNSVVDALTNSSADLSARLTAEPGLRKLTLPKSLSFGHAARLRLAKLFEMLPSLSVRADTNAGVLNLSGDLSSIDEDLSLNAVSARMAINQLRQLSSNNL